MHHHEEGALSSEMELQALKERGVEAVNKVSRCLYHYSDNSRTIFSWRAWYRQTTPKIRCQDIKNPHSFLRSEDGISMWCKITLQLQVPLFQQQELRPELQQPRELLQQRPSLNDEYA